MTKLDRAAGRAVAQSLRLRRGEAFLLVTDGAKLEIAEALARAARAAGAETTTYLMAEALRPIQAPTALFRELIARASATAYLLESRIEEKAFRSFMVAEGAKHGRILMMPGITRDMMERLVGLDYAELHALGKRLIAALRGAAEVRVTSPAGTDIAFGVRGRTWRNSSGDLGRKGAHGNLPAGEVYTAPVEETFTGRVVIGLVDDKPGRGVLDFERGRLVRWSGRGIAAVARTIGDDATGFVIGEFGIGTNRGARVCPNMLEAEKAFGTAHFAIGDSYGLGLNKSRFHYDGLVEDVTIEAKGRAVIRGGRFLV